MYTFIKVFIVIEKNLHKIINLNAFLYFNCHNIKLLHTFKIENFYFSKKYIHRIKFIITHKLHLLKN